MLDDLSKEKRRSHPRSPRGGQPGREKKRDGSFEAWAEEARGTDSLRTISKRSSERCLLIGHKRRFILLCPIGLQQFLSSFRELDSAYLSAIYGRYSNSPPPPPCPSVTISAVRKHKIYHLQLHISDNYKLGKAVNDKSQRDFPVVAVCDFYQI